MKFFFGLLAFIAATVVVVLLVISLFRSLGSGSDTSRQTQTTFDFSSEEAVNSVVSYTVSGPIVAEENFREIRITVSKNSRSIEEVQGFNGVISRSQSYPNTEQAYQAFIGALVAAQFADVRINNTDDQRTTCVTGSRLLYVLSIDGERKVDSWGTTCSTRQGTFAGNQTGTAQVFQAQIPDYALFVQSVTIPRL